MTYAFPTFVTLSLTLAVVILLSMASYVFFERKLYSLLIEKFIK